MKRLLLSLMVSLCLVSFLLLVSADQKEIKRETRETDLSIIPVTEYGEVKEQDFIIFDNREIRLSPTFVDADKAMEKFSACYPDYIKNLREFGNITTSFGISSLSDYVAASYSTIESLTCGEPVDSPDYYDQELEDFLVYHNKLTILSDFIDGSRMNSEVYSLFEKYGYDGEYKYVSELGHNAYVITDYRDNECTVAEMLRILKLYLPYTCTTLDDVSSEQVQQRTVETFNINDACAYAHAYANVRNSDYHDFGSTDCTNFASQIAYAGGKQFDYTGEDNEQWWYKDRPLIVDDWTLTWTVADKFVNYFGTDIETSSFSAFQHNLSRGDFIAMDEDNDGYWNHVGFVTETSRCARYNNQGTMYLNFKVAQHSEDYEAWASSSLNGWEVTSSQTKRYAIVRMN